nr:hypothetical protein CFP56_03180 [Quercus suber]
MRPPASSSNRKEQSMERYDDRDICGQSVVPDPRKSRWRWLRSSELGRTYDLARLENIAIGTTRCSKRLQNPIFGIEKTLAMLVARTC